jgi:hypothetical protein
MRGIVAIALFGACAFNPGVPAGTGGGGGGGGGGGVDAAATVNRPACDLSDPSVRLCLDFDVMPLGLDSSSGQHDAVVSSATPTMRTIPAYEQAVAVDMTSSIQVAETPALDITDAITYEGWLAPHNAPPTGTFYSALDNSGQYAIELEPDGRARCFIAGRYIDSHDPIPLGTNAWTHVACTYDRDNIMIYINGGVSDCYQSTTQIPTSGTTGTRIAKAFVGAIDNIHVLARAATGSEVCAHAGQSDCENMCPGSDGGGFHPGF